MIVSYKPQGKCIKKWENLYLGGYQRRKLAKEPGKVRPEGNKNLG